MPARIKAYPVQSDHHLLISAAMSPFGVFYTTKMQTTVSSINPHLQSVE